MTARRIGLVTPGWPGQNTPNGIATSVYQLATGLRAIGQAPVILTRRIDGPCPDDIPVHTIPEMTWRWRDRLTMRLGDAGTVQRVVARAIAAAVHAAGALDVLIMEETNGWAGMVRPHVSCPVIITLHGPWVLLKTLQPSGNAQDDRAREQRESRAFLAVDGLIGPSRSVLEAVEQGVDLSARQRIVIPNALALNDPGPLAAAQDNRDILFVGRFDRVKGGDTVIDAFGRLLETHPQARLTFAGVDKGIRQPDGEMYHIAQALAAAPAEVQARLTFLGPLEREEIVRLRETHAIALIASRYETFSYTMLEAMAAGQALVCTAVGGLAEVLVHEDTALMVPPDDPEAMAQALARLIGDTALVESLGQSGRARLERDCSPAHVARDTVDFIETILAARAR